MGIIAEVDLQTENERLRKENLLLEKECGEQESTIEALEGDISDLEDEIEELENADGSSEYVKVLERFADHFNWTGSSWTPLIKGMDEHPADIAHRVLKENL